MTDRYKLILFKTEGWGGDGGLYREVELGPELEEVRIGTSADCAVRLRRELFFAPMELILCRRAGEWSLSCSDGLYFTAGDMRRILNRRLVHGDELHVKYRDSDYTLLSLSFQIDFENEKKEYDTEIHIAGKERIKIGGRPDSDILLTGADLGEDSMTLKREQGKLRLYDNGSRYGVCVNGVRTEGPTELKDHDFFSLGGASFYYRSGRLYAAGGGELCIRGLANRREAFGAPFRYPQFNRSPRVRRVTARQEIHIQQAPPKPVRPKRNMAMALIPSLILFAMTIVLRGFLGGGGTFVIYSAVSLGLSIVMTIAASAAEKRDYNRAWTERLESYDRYIEGKRRQIEEARRGELRDRNEMYVSLEESVREVERWGRRLFEKGPEDEDFLRIFLGRGRVESADPVTYSCQEFADLQDPLAGVPAQVAQSYRYIENAPVFADLRASRAVGVAGPGEMRRQMLKNMALDIGIRHFYKDVKMAFILEESTASALAWVRWLPHAENERLGLRNIACDEESLGLVLEDLYITLSARQKEGAKEEKRSGGIGPRYVVFVADLSVVKAYPLFRYVQSREDYGFTFVFFGEYEELLPRGCQEIIRLKDMAGRTMGTGTIIKVSNGNSETAFSFSPVSDERAAAAGRRLGAVTVKEASRDRELPRTISLFELLGIVSAQDLDLGRRWDSAQVWNSLAAPIGIRAKNQTVYLDIGDGAGAHGPHGLVAGTTGSGKSELLQTYILSMATLFHPYEAGFVLIDFKGGGMANQFQKLPHLMGTITNIDGRQINRSLLSIKAELLKRQEIFSQVHVNHINDYIKLYKSGRTKTALPHLIIIVDEFAQLKQEYPDFMKELISAARIGRTLGIHLILATQKPAGVVDAQIWSNSRFRLCLKVQTKEDSGEVLKTPLAAELVEPGRAYFQVGNNEIFELFQSAYSKAPAPQGSGEKYYAIYERNLWGKRTLKYTNKRPENDSFTQIEAVVSQVESYCRSRKIERLPGICLPPLKERIFLDALEEEGQEGGIGVPVGLYDDPQQQRQGTVTLNISGDNTYIVGSAQTGKTTLLQTILCGLIGKYTSEQVNLYIIDCAGMLLRIFEDSAQVGGVVLAGEEEKCRNLFKLLSDRMTRRKKLMSERRVGSYAASREAGYTDMPMIVVVIDNMAAFREYFPEQVEMLGILARESLGAGLSFVVTAASAGALNYRTQASFGCRLALNCNDTGEYSSLFGHCRTTPGENAGRGLFMLEKRILEFQTAVFGRSERETDRSRELSEFIRSRSREGGARAVRIPMVPKRLSLEEMLAKDRAAFGRRGILPVGMDFSTVELTSINLARDGFLALLGDGGCRQRFVDNLLRLISQTAVIHGLEVFIADDCSGRLAPFASCSFTGGYTSDLAGGLSLIGEFCENILRPTEKEERKNFCMLIAAGEEVLQKICADKAESRRLAQAIRGAAQARAFILLAAVENQPVTFQSSEVLKTIREERRAILFADLPESRLFDMGGRVRPDAGFDSTMGYRFSGGACFKIKIFDGSDAKGVRGE